MRSLTSRRAYIAGSTFSARALALGSSPSETDAWKPLSITVRFSPELFQKPSYLLHAVLYRALLHAGDLGEVRCSLSHFRKEGRGGGCHVGVDEEAHRLDLD